MQSAYLLTSVDSWMSSEYIVERGRGDRHTNGPSNNRIYDPLCPKNSTLSFLGNTRGMNI
jgi:hypothetical protein